MNLHLRNALLLCTASLVLVWQVFGMNRGFLCDCGGQMEVTLFDHCHGPHGEMCHTTGDFRSHEDEHHDDHGDTREHAPVQETLLSSSGQFQKVHLPAPTSAAPVWELGWSGTDDFEWGTATPRHLQRRERFNTGPPPDPWTVRLARTIALRI